MTRTKHHTKAAYPNDRLTPQTNGQAKTKTSELDLLEQQFDQAADAAEQHPRIEIERIVRETLRVPIVGTTPLICHRFAEKAKRQMLLATQGKPQPKEPKDPEAEYDACFYRLGVDGQPEFGHPADAFKEATVAAARFYGKKQLTMTELKQFVFVSGIPSDAEGRVLVPIEGEPKKREDVVKVGRSGADLRYRPAFWPWHAELVVFFYSSVLDQKSVLSLIEAGGQAVGVGDWRPEREGMFGTYQIDPERPVEVVSS